MYVKSLEMENFRNIKSAKLNPANGVNVIFGNNAQGKTNLIEGLYFCSGMGSFRGAKESELRQFEKEYFSICCGFHSFGRDRKIVIRSSEQKRKISLSDVEMKSYSALCEHFKCVVFFPDDLSLIKRSPDNRRRFLDNALCTLKPGYKKLISEYYKASAEAVTNDNALSRINGWVKESTNEKIDSIIDSPDFDSVLINAIYFKGTWLNRFEKNATQKDVFNERNGDKTETDFMNTTAHFNNAYTDNVRIIELPYTNRSDVFDNEGNYVRTETLDGADISMYILMPDSDIAINPCELISKCKSKNLLSSSNINLSMPKFKIEYSKNLNDVLKTAGINKAFTGQAEFSPMFDKGSMYIDKVLQKTYIDVDENGTEAAAVTAVIMECASAMPDEPEKLCLDRPFTFVIMDNTENEALFIGEYAYVE